MSFGPAKSSTAKAPAGMGARKASPSSQKMPHGNAHTKPPASFEGSKRDVDTKRAPEGSRADTMRDMKQSKGK